MNALKRFITTVPPWAFVCVLIVLFVQSANMYYNARMMVSGERESNINGHWIIDYVDPGGPVDKAGIKIGDTIVSCNHYTIEEWRGSGDTYCHYIQAVDVPLGLLAFLCIFRPGQHCQPLHPV